MLFFPEMVLDARTTFEHFVAHPLIEPLLDQMHLVLVNYPHQGQLEDGETYDEAFRAYPSFDKLSSTMQIAVTEIKAENPESQACVCFGVGLGAALAMHMATTAPDLFNGIILVSPPKLKENLNERLDLSITEMTQTTAQKNSSLPASFVRRFMRRWFNDGKMCRLSPKTMDEFRAACNMRMPAHTLKLIKSYYARSPYRVDIRCPTLVLHGTDTSTDHCLPSIESMIEDVTVVPIKGRGMAHIESTRDCVVHLVTFFKTLGLSVRVDRTLLLSAERDIKTLWKTTTTATRAAFRLRLALGEARIETKAQEPVVQWSGHYAMRPAGMEAEKHIEPA